MIHDWCHTLGCSLLGQSSSLKVDRNMQKTNYETGVLRLTWILESAESTTFCVIFSTFDSRLRLTELSVRWTPGCAVKWVSGWLELLCELRNIFRRHSVSKSPTRPPYKTNTQCVHCDYLCEVILLSSMTVSVLCSAHNQISPLILYQYSPTPSSRCVCFIMYNHLRDWCIVNMYVLSQLSIKM